MAHPEAHDGLEWSKMIECMQYVARYWEWIRVVGDASMSNLQALASISDAALAQVHANVTSTICDIRTVQNSRTPVNRMPNEVLGTIFDLVPLYMPVKWKPVKTVFSNKQYLGTLIRVCRAWTSIALSTPSLWYCIDIVCTDPATWDTALAYLRHSGSVPLTVNLEYSRYPQFIVADLDGFHPIAAALASQANQIEEVHIDDMTCGALATLDRPTLSYEMAPVLPRLRRLVVTLECDNEQEDTVDATRLLWHQSRSPNLHTLSVSGCTTWLKAQLPVNLQELILIEQDWSTSECSRLLLVSIASCRRLNVLVVSGCAVQQEMTTSVAEMRPTVGLSNLKQLVLDENCPDLSRLLLGRLRVPEDCAQQITFGYDNFHWTGHFPASFSAQRMAITTKIMIAVKDPSSALSLKGTDIQSLSILMEPRLCVDVTELWLDVNASSLTPTISSFKNLKRLVLRVTVLYHSLNPILEDLHANFALTEICLFTRNARPHEQELTSFLGSRREAGFPVQTLHFCSMGGDNWDAMSTRLEATCAVFRGIFPDMQVGYEVVEEPPCMEVPAICKTPIGTHNLWDTSLWKSWS